MEILQRTLVYIDAHLGETLDVESLAARAGYSPFHFCRVFLWGVGYPVMGYVRSRRLAHAAYALQRGGRILDVALESGFETHSGFSRAFRRQFGCPPEVYRMHARFPRPLPPDLSRMLQYRIGGIVLEPRFVTLPAKKLAGYALRTTMTDRENLAAIPAFWSAYMSDGRMKRLHAESFVKNHSEYGACFPENPQTGEFDYLIGVEVPEGTQVPAGYDRRVLPTAEYAVFSTPPCRAADFSASIQGVWNYIFNDWFPASGWEYAPGCTDFELYDDRCMSEAGKVCEIWVPVVKKGG